MERPTTLTLLAGCCGRTANWIDTRLRDACYNHGNAKGMEAGLLFDPKVGKWRDGSGDKGNDDAAHDVMLAKGDFILSAALLERIYLAMDAKRHNYLLIVQGNLTSGLTTSRRPGRTR